jgi:GTP-binding protein HflX
MLDQEFHIDTSSKASIITMVCPDFEGHKTLEESEHSLNELKELLRTLRMEVVSQHLQNRKTIDPATIIGSGKLQEIAKEAESDGANILICDFDLTASQIRNIRKITGLPVIDRCHIILEIFARHARTREAKIQIEISRLQYLLPRLSGFWTHLSRQKGGLGVNQKGEGEKQIELDRRIVRERIEDLKEEITSIEKSREQQKKKRQNKVVSAAIVGYTNAGKSSLMNRLCKVNVLEEDKLFATLDSTFRTLNPDSKPPMVLIDTVGFISNLPSSLVEGFKTTLESALEADLIIVVVDISDPNYKKHIEVTDSVLNELKVEHKERIIVFNKADKVASKFEKQIIKKGYKDSFVVSSYSPEDMENLRKYIINHFLQNQREVDLFVPYQDGHSHSQIIGKTNVISTKNHETGIYYKIKAPEAIFNFLNLEHYILAPENPLRAALDLL